MQVPVDVWHTKEAVIKRLEAENTEDSKRLIRLLKKRETQSNALSYVATALLCLTIAFIVGIINGALMGGATWIFLCVMIAMTIVAFYGSMRLEESAIVSIIKHFKQIKTANGHTRQKK